MKEYFYLAMAVICIGLQLVFTKLYQKKVGSSFVATVFFNMVVALISFILFLCVSLFKINFSIFSTVLAAILAIIFSFNGLLAVKICGMGNMSVYTLFLMSGGMMIPFVFGVVFLDERISVFRYFALTLIVVALIFQYLKECGRNTEKKEVGHIGKTAITYYVFCILIFITNGLAGVVSKMHQDTTVFARAGFQVTSVSTDNFLVITYFFMLVINAMVFVICQCRKKQFNCSVRHAEMPGAASSSIVKQSADEPFETGLKGHNFWIMHPVFLVLFIVVAEAAFSSAGYFLQLLGAYNLDASLLYPVITGGTIIIGGIFGRIFFHEKIGLFEFFSIVLAFTATILFVF